MCLSNTRAFVPSLTRSLQASPVLLSTKEEVTSFLQEVPHPELAGYHPDRVMGLFKTQLHTGRKLSFCVLVLDDDDLSRFIPLK